MSQPTLKATVLISGTGSNLKALIDAVESGELDLDIMRVISNRAKAPGLQHASNAGIAVSVISHKDYPDRESHDAAVAQYLESDRPCLIVLAGYMRILSETFAKRYSDRMINLHPSLLPLHKGLDTYNRALQAGDRETGASIHFVTAGLDSGPVISQIRIPVFDDDNAESLSARLGPLEHKLVVATVKLFSQKKITLRAGTVYLEGKALEKPLLLKDDGTFSATA